MTDVVGTDDLAARRELAMTSPCWFVGCTTRIPRREEYVPRHDGQVQQQFVVDNQALLAHMSEAHPKARDRWI